MWAFQEMGMGAMNPPADATAPSARPPPAERRPRPHKEQPLSCPRCHSANTKFCYYNNYSLSQPRYFCKTCRRYWTEGGSLRNVPIGGGSRKNKRHSSNPISTGNPSSSSSRNSDLLPPPLPAATSSFRNPKFLDGFSSMEMAPLVPDYAPAFGVDVGFPVEAFYGVEESGMRRGLFPIEDLNFEQRSQEGGASALWNGFNGHGSW